RGRGTLASRRWLVRRSTRSWAPPSRNDTRSGAKQAKIAGLRLGPGRGSPLSNSMVLALGHDEPNRMRLAYQDGTGISRRLEPLSAMTKDSVDDDESDRRADPEDRCNPRPWTGWTHPELPGAGVLRPGSE